jgi:predicted nucleic acid-binding protein
VKAFFDSNVLIYAFSSDTRKQRAAEVLADGGTINAQVLNEFTNVLRKKQQRGWEEIEAALGVVHSWFDPVRPLTSALHGKAVDLARAHGFAFYDTLIVAAAIEAGCDTLYTEDMQHGRTLDGVTFRNPFIA